MHFDSCSLITPSILLLLQNVLHVPHISKPLLSISQLITDNNAYVESNKYYYLIKDLTTHQVLLQDIQANGLYIISSYPPQALSCEQSSLHL
jgi:hypothetical protein